MAGPRGDFVCSKDVSKRHGECGMSGNPDMARTYRTPAVASSLCLPHSYRYRTVERQYRTELPTSRPTNFSSLRKEVQPGNQRRLVHACKGVEAGEQVRRAAGNQAGERRQARRQARRRTQTSTLRPGTHPERGGPSVTTTYNLQTLALVKVPLLFPCPTTTMPAIARTEERQTTRN